MGYRSAGELNKLFSSYKENKNERNLSTLIDELYKYVGYAFTKIKGESNNNDSVLKDEVISSVALKVYKQLIKQDFDPKCEFATYVSKAVVNKTRDCYKRDLNKIVFCADDVFWKNAKNEFFRDNDLANNDHIGDKIGSAFKNLAEEIGMTDGRKKHLELVLAGDKTFNEIAQETGTSSGFIKSNYSKIRGQFRTSLKKRGLEGNPEGFLDEYYDRVSVVDKGKDTTSRQ